MKADKLINFAALNKVFNLERGTLRAGRLPKTHEPKVNELLNMVQYWIDKHSKQRS